MEHLFRQVTNPEANVALSRKRLVGSDLKKGLEQIAHREARSVSQICQILLTIGTEAYNKEGSKYLQTYLGNSKKG